MTTATQFTMPTRTNALDGTLTLDSVQQHAPAVFATSASARTSAAYTFISTARVLEALMQAGFVPVDARQSRTRRTDPAHARHALRLRRRYETVQLRDSIPEVLFINSHDGTTAYQLRVGLFRVVCTNGLVVSLAAFPIMKVAHRGDVVTDVVHGALELSKRFSSLAASVERMEARQLDDHERWTLARQALALRFPDLQESGMQASALLECRRPEDIGRDLWRTFNVIQENLLRGGLRRRSASGRLTRTRAITAIREDVRLNTRLWDLATAFLAA